MSGKVEVLANMFCSRADYNATTYSIIILYRLHARELNCAGGCSLISLPAEPYMDHMVLCSNYVIER